MTQPSHALKDEAEHTLHLLHNVKSPQISPHPMHFTSPFNASHMHHHSTGAWNAPHGTFRDLCGYWSGPPDAKTAAY